MMAMNTSGDFAAGARVDFVPRPFRPAWWAPGPNRQTLLARALRRPPPFPYRRERLETPDGDFLDLDWAPEPRPGAPWVLVLHGLEGSSSRSYVRNACAELMRRGLQPVVMNFRGCSGEPNRLPRFYHSAETGDPKFVLQVLSRRDPDRRLGALGFSLGGNVLLRLLAEEAASGTHRLHAAAAMSVPYDLSAGCRLLERSRMGRVYTLYFLRSLRRKVLAKAALLKDHVDVDAALEAPTIRAFDEVVTAPLAGYADAEDYYRHASSAPVLASIRTPTLLLHAMDDPFLPSDAVPRQAVRANPALCAAFTPEGGHVGFLGGLPWRPRFWADEEAARYLAAALSEHASEEC